MVTIQPTDKDRYGRIVAWVYVDGKSLNEALILAGLSWHYKKYSSERVNHKSIECGNKNPPDPDDRDNQFKHIEKKRKQYAKAGNPVISVDTKKKELIGNFKNAGSSWEKEPINGIR